MEEKQKESISDQNNAAINSQEFSLHSTKAKFYHVGRNADHPNKPLLSQIKVQIEDIPQPPPHPNNYQESFERLYGIGIYLAKDTAPFKNCFIRARLTWKDSSWVFYIETQNEEGFSLKPFVNVVDTIKNIKPGSKPLINIKPNTSGNQDPDNCTTWDVMIDNRIFSVETGFTASKIEVASVYCVLPYDQCSDLPADKVVSFTNLEIKDFYGNHIDPIWNLGNQSQQTCGMLLTPFNGKLIQDPDTYETTQINLTWHNYNKQS